MAGSLVVDSINNEDVSSGFFGVGQAWQEVTADRSIGVTYTNSTGKSIFISLLLGSASGVSGTDINVLLVDGVKVFGEADTDDKQDYSYNTLVPNGSSYIVYGDGNSYIRFWSELR